MANGKAEPLPDKQQLLQAVETAQKAQKAQNKANDLMSKASKFTNSKEREKMIQEAYAKEVEAHGDTSRTARRMTSGTWQGLAAGGGIGAGVGMGVGTVVGTLVGGLTAIPTTALGGLVGTGVGAIHGPFIKLGNGQKKRLEDAKPEEIADAIEQEQNPQKRIELKQQVEDITNQPGDVPGSPSRGVSNPVTQRQRHPNKKPRKIEIRSGNVMPVMERTPSRDNVKRPRKLEVRSPSQRSMASQVVEPIQLQDNDENEVPH